MRINSPYITGSATITGNLCVQGTITGTITGIASTASYAETLDGLDSTQFVQTGSFNSYTSSASSSLGDLSGSVAITTNTLSSSVSSSIGSLSGSVATTTSNLSSSIGSLSGSVATTTSGLSSSIGSLSSSVATTTSGLGGRITTIEGNYATTGSNMFIGTQVITGSLYISSDLVVQGSSSLQNITASAVNIGANIVNLNTANPAIRFAGLNIFDSGSIGGSGSFLYDAVEDEFIFVHRGDNANITSSVALMGPQTYNNIGNETYPTANRILKGNGNEHVGDSCIQDVNGTVTIGGTLCTSGVICAPIIIGSTNICSPQINATTNLTANTANIQPNAASGLSGLYLQNNNTGGYGVSLGLGLYGYTTCAYFNTLRIESSYPAYGRTLFFTKSQSNSAEVLALNWDGTGVACFSNTVCAPAFVGGTINGTTGVLSSNLTAANFISDGSTFYSISLKGRAADNYGAIGFYSNNGATRTGYIQYGTICGGQVNITGDGGGSITLDNRGIGVVGVACFSNTICAPKFIATHLAATCLTLNGFSSGNGFKMDYGSASGQITAINLMANGTTNGFIGIQMVDGSNGDLWFGSSANRSMTVYRTTGHVGFGIDAPCTRVHAEGGYGSRWGGNSCYYGGGVSGGGSPFGDEYGNGASYTYQTANTTATNGSLFGGYAAGYFKGGGGSAYGGGGAGVLAIGGDGANAENVNSGGGAGLFARGGKNGAGSLHSYAGWFDGGNVMVRCGFLGVNNTAPRTFVHIVGASCGADVACGFGNADSRGILHVEACSGIQNSNVTVETVYGIGQFMQWSTNGMRIGHRILKGGGTGDVHMTAGQDSVKLLIYTTGNIGAPSGSNIYAASDCRLKKNIRTISYGLSDVMKLQPKVFNWKDNFTPSENGKEMLGFVAQDIQTIIPEVVEQFSDGSDITFDCETITNPLRVNEKFIIPILTRAIQEQQCIICSQSSMINTLKTCLGIL